MSRVDDALKAWEKQQGRAASAELKPVDGEVQRFVLNGYSREASRNGSSAPHVEHKAPVTSRPYVPAAAARFVPPDEEFRARFIDADSATVPLEQYRRLASVLHDVQVQQGLNALILTSALPGEGKTLTTINLARTLSDSYNRRVLLVDADLRRPGVHTVLGIANETGLIDVLREDVEALPIHNLSSNLAVLTAGRPGHAPLAGLTSDRMKRLLEDAAKQFDWVLLDTPPVNLLPDASVLTRLTRAVVFVIAANSTPSAAVQRAISELGSEHIIGTVLNRVGDRRIPAADYYDYYRRD